MAGALSAAIHRVPNATLQMPSAPPVFGYSLTNAFGNLTFTNAVALRTPPGETNRIFVVEQGGRIAVITNLANPNRSTFLDISSRILGGAPTDERGLLGLAFHPGYATNRLFFVFYTGTATTTAGTGLHDILARYRATPGNPNLADPASEVRLMVQFDDYVNHNAGDLHFGPDGYLYVSLGDEGDANDTGNNSQTITKDFFSAIMRLDVDKAPGSLRPNVHPASTTNYAVPPDNPFVGATTFNGQPISPSAARTEFWAVGLRNPWRFCFDPDTGRLYCADVGQNQWEELNIITRGGNYGWAFREGLHGGPKAAPPGVSAINPILEYGHGSGANQGFSITGGVVYRGSRLSQLTGAYVFADYVSGNIWSTFYNGTNTSLMQRLTGETGIAGFGIDPRNGDVLLVNQTTDRIRRLVYSPTFIGAPIPPLLSQAGAFSDLSSLTPQAGIVPYDLNVPFWSDNALKTRWFSIPNTNLTMTFSRDGNWLFPTGSVWIKHFEMELTNGSAASRKRLETRLLVKTSSGAYGVTYRWGNSTTDAALVSEEGLDETFVINNGSGILRTQVWHYPSRQECLLCHTPAGGFVMGFSTAQLNRTLDYSGVVTNQIATLSEAGYFNAAVTGIHTLPALAHPTNAGASLEYRARSYLAANCAQCHRPGGAPQALWDARFSTPTANAGLVNGPLVDYGGNTNNRTLKPGSLSQSMILSRIATLGSGRMPPLGSSVLDESGIRLLSAWITNDLPNYQTFADWQVSKFGGTNLPNALAGADPDKDLAVNQLEYLTGTDPLIATSYWSVSVQRTDNGLEVTWPQVANRGFELQRRQALSGAAQWSALDAPGNEPFFSAINRTARVFEGMTNAESYYRVRVFAP